MVLVVGSTGLLGGEICQQLADKKIPVKALVRKTADEAKVAHLKGLGCTLAEGDLKDPASLAEACQGVKAVISTASSTFSRQDGDSIQTVDLEGQLNLVNAAQAAGVEQFILISFPDTEGYDNPLNDAKRAVEQRLQESGMNYISIQANYFMEIWLSPALGFDFGNQAVRIYGEGQKALNFVSYLDVAKIAVACLDNPAAKDKIISFGGPAALSPLEVVQLFEQISGTEYAKEFIPQEGLEHQYASTEDPMGKSFSSLILVLARGLPMEMEETSSTFGLTLNSVEDYARRVLGK
jgi:uncharacterized protein YbjT (DUF2867 family)